MIDSRIIDQIYEEEEKQENKQVVEEKKVENQVEPKSSEPKGRSSKYLVEQLLNEMDIYADRANLPEVVQKLRDEASNLSRLIWNLIDTYSDDKLYKSVDDEEIENLRKSYKKIVKSKIENITSLLKSEEVVEEPKEQQPQEVTVDITPGETVKAPTEKVYTVVQANEDKVLIQDVKDGKKFNVDVSVYREWKNKE